MAKKRKDKSRRTASAERADGRPEPTNRFVRYSLVLTLLGVTVLAWVSLLSYSPTDPPSPMLYAPQRPVANMAGLVGAYIAYGLHTWLGGGAHIALMFTSVVSLVMVFGGRVIDVPWRIVGAALMVLATSAALYLRDPGAGADPLTGPAGEVGRWVGHFLKLKFDVMAWLILAVAFCIGVMLAADNLVLGLPRLGAKLWKKGKELPSLAGVFRPRPWGPATSDVRTVTASPRAAAAMPAAAGKKPAPRPKPVVAAEAPEPAKETARPESSPAVAAEKALAVRPTPPAAAPAEDAKAKEKDKDKDKDPSALARLTAALTPARKEAPKPPAKKPPANEPPTIQRDFSLPSVDLLTAPTGGYNETQEQQAEIKRGVLQQTLNDFNVEAQVVAHQTGPVITLFELALAPGVKVSQIANLANDIARALAVPGVRVVSPLPGRDTVGIEVPNIQKEIVRIRELMNLDPQAEQKKHLPLYLGKDAGGSPIVADLAGMPHMLIAGTTGSGKSVCINAIITSLLMTRSPAQARLILIDPKMVEMAAFENIPHLLCPIVNDMRKAEEILEWAATKMDERYELLREANVRNIAEYNRLGREEILKRMEITADDEAKAIPAQLPYYVIIIDELADLIMTSSKEVEGHIIRIAQKARAVGIHLILATQRPSVNVVTGLIKSNMPCRISFRVASRQESRIVLDQNGADVLLGHGDMLFLQPGTSSLVRAQGTYVDDNELRQVVSAVSASGPPQFETELLRLNSSADVEGTGQRDELFDQGVEIVLASQRGSVSLLQRRLQVGYSRASRIIDQMADAGLLGDYKGSQARECLMTLEDWRALKASIAADQSGASSADGEPMSV